MPLNQFASPCAICHDPSEKSVLCRVTLGPGTEYDLVRCRTCGVMFVQPLPSDEALAAFYSAEYFDFERHKYEGRGRAFARKYLRGHARGRFLDVGCATGFFLNGVRRESGWSVCGVDIGEPAVRFARAELGLDVRAGELSASAFPPESFDFIHVSNILEHARQPVAVLEECRRIIAPGGRLFLSIPNGAVDSRDLIRFHRAEGQPARSRSGHIFFFPAGTLRRVVHDAGFSIQDSRTYGIRRGLRILGWYPRSHRWKAVYRPKARPRVPDAPAIVVPVTKKHGDWYYQYRFTQNEMKMLPGLKDVGLDFQLVLVPRGRAIAP
jgi:2-polyprenyl-3-methyl-5-hydroxy-6-metoxy-1,4-benzoquinol methylase